jgi:hypothetical protein
VASRLLIDSEPLQVLPQLAKQIGLNEAIFLQQLHYWLQKSEHEHDERRWVYNTFDNWHAQFPFWSLRTMQRIASRLVKKKLLVVRRFKATDWDQTNWYSIDYEQLSTLSADGVKLTGPIASTCRLRSRQLDEIIIGSEITTEITTERGAAKPQPPPAAVQLWRKLTHRYPPKDLWSIFTDRLGATPNEEKLKEVIQTWKMRGYKIVNYEGILEWYSRGIPSPNGYKQLPTQAEMNAGGRGRLVI